MSDIPKQKKAAIDIGTNSIKLCIAESSTTSLGFFVIHDEIKVAHLGEGLSEVNELGTLPSERSIQIIQRFVAKAHKFGANEIRAVGTAALRKAANACIFCRRVRDTCGIDVEIIEGEREAQLSYSAVASSASGQDSTIFDIGGGSIEFIYSLNNKICSRFSLSFGVLSIKENYFFHEPDNNSVSKACHEIEYNLREGGLLVPKSKLFIGIGGTVTTMASVKLKLPKFLPHRVNGTVINKSDVESQIHQYQNTTLEERAKIPGLHADRADIILAGACIVKTIMDFYSTRNVIVSTNGIRHAVLAEMFR
jgi:exopolyphosphatase/guanosine-5'-triphosphate,3'-diphosphate pyrophosphatase